MSPLLLLAGLAVAADGDTYCVGGYTGTPKVLAPLSVQTTCNRPRIRHMHPKWHHHFYVRKGDTCFQCWDELDNTCRAVFLKKNPQYQAADAFECRRLGAMYDYGQLIAHVIDGKPVKPKPKPKPNPKPKPVDDRSQEPEPATRVDLVSEMEAGRTTPGPYAAGDRVTVVASVREGRGVRAVAGGRFTVRASGTTRTVTGTVRRDGRVSASITLPQADAVTVEFTPELTLDDGERLALAAGQEVVLRASVFSGATPAEGSASLSFSVAVDGEPTVTIPAAADGSARWSPPASPTARSARLFVSGTAGGKRVCPGEAVAVEVSDLAVGFDTSGLPTTCWVGLPCTGEVRLRRPSAGPARHQLDQALAAPGVEVVLFDGATELARSPVRADDVYRFEQTYPAVQAAEWRLELRGAGAGVSMPAHHLHVREGLVLDLPEVLDFGVVRAGTPWWEVCGRLDFTGSRSAEEHRWRLEPQGLDECVARPVLAYTNAAGRPDRASLAQVVDIDALDPDALWLDICLEVPACAGERSPEAAGLVVAPLTDAFAAQRATVGLRWEVTDRSFLACWARFLVPGGGLLGLLFLLAGVVRPHRFPPDATLRTGSTLRALKRSSGALLRGFPRSSSGFYQDARLGLQADGTASGRVRGARVVIRAVRGGGVLTGAGLEVRNRRAGRWEAVPDAATGHAPDPSAVYRAGRDLLFRVEA